MSLISIQDRYLAALLAQPAVSTITLADGSSVRVEDVYLPRTLLHEVKQKELEREPGRGEQTREGGSAPEHEITVKLPVDVWSKLDKERVVVVEGPAGIGKSTLTKQLVRESRAHYPIPIWIAFRPFVASGLSLADYLDQYYVPWLGLAGLRVPYRADGTGPERSVGQWLFEQWKDGFGGLLIVDGLDEVFQYDERVTALQGLPIIRTGAIRPATIFTSRPLSQSLVIPMAKVEVQGLTPTEQLQFVERYRASLQLTKDQVTHFTSATKKQEQGRLRELLTHPGHLIQILTTYAKTNTLLDTETAVLDQLLQGRLTITGRSEPPVEPDEPEKKHLVLASLALHLLACRQGQRHTRAQLLALIQQVLREHATNHTPLFPLAQATALLNDLTRNSALLTEVEPEVYECETVIWLQHLTGAALANQHTIASLNLTDPQVLDFLDKKAWDPAWEPVLKSWVGTTDEPFQLFACLIDKMQDDMARHRLGIAGCCLVEVRVRLREQSLYPTLKARIHTEVYRVWKAQAKRSTLEFVETSLARALAKMDLRFDQVCVMLDSSRVAIRKGAIRMVRHLHASMPIAAEQMLRMQLLNDFSVREEASAALAEVGTGMPALQNELVAMLNSRSNQLRCWTVSWLHNLEADAPLMVLEALAARLKDKSRSVRMTAKEVFEDLGAKIPLMVGKVLVPLLTDRSTDVRLVAMRIFEDLRGETSSTMREVLVALLKDPLTDMRSAAVRMLGRLGGKMSLEVQKALVACLDDRSEYVRNAAIMALGNLGGQMSPIAREALVAKLHEEDFYVRIIASYALEGGMSQRMQETVVLGLGNSGVEVRRAIVDALEALEILTPQIMQEALVPRLLDVDEHVRHAAMRALIGPTSEMPPMVQQALVERLNDADICVRVNAIYALNTLGPEMPLTVQEALIAQLDDQDEVVRLAAVEGLGKLGIEMPLMVQEVLVEQLADEAEEVRSAAVSALEAVGTNMPAILQERLVTYVKHDSEDVSWAAARLLRELGAKMSLRVQELLAAFLVNSAKTSRFHAIRALENLEAKEMSPMVQSAIMTCAEDKDDKDTRVRQFALSTLINSGVKLASPALGALVAQLKDSTDEYISAGALRDLMGWLGTEVPVVIQEVVVTRLIDRSEHVRNTAAEVLTIFHHKGHRLFVADCKTTTRTVSELSATAPFPDSCCVLPHSQPTLLIAS